MDCPKCGHKGFEGDECPSCGVIVSKYLAAKKERKARLDASLSRLKGEGFESQGRNIPSSKFSLFGILDLNFEKIYMANFLKIFYVLGILFLISLIIAELRAGSSSNFSEMIRSTTWKAGDESGVIYVLDVFVRALLAWVLLRMFLEFFILICRIEKHLRSLRYSKIDEEDFAE